jgi:hypothetical protein
VRPGRANTNPSTAGSAFGEGGFNGAICPLDLSSRLTSLEQISWAFDLVPRDAGRGEQRGGLLTLDDLLARNLRAVRARLNDALSSLSDGGLEQACLFAIARRSAWLIFWQHNQWYVCTRTLHNR